MSTVLNTIQHLCDGMISFKELVRERRKTRGWTQSALALHLNRTTSYVSELENPEKPLPPSLLLSQVLEIASVLELDGKARTTLIDAFFCAALVRLVSG